MHVDSVRGCARGCGVGTDSVMGARVCIDHDDWLPTSELRFVARLPQ